MKEGSAGRLAALQARMAQALFEIGGDPPATVLEAIIPGGTLDARGAFEVYRGGYVARLTEQLGETYEAVWWAVGDEEFFALCRDFIATRRSQSYNLSDYGRSFPAFLGCSAAAADAPFLEELAKFELAFADLFHAREHDHLEGDALAGLADPVNLTFEFGHATFLRRHRFAVERLWRLRKGPQQAARGVEVETAERILGFKLGGDVHLLRLEEADFAILEGLAAGERLGDALEGAAAVGGGRDAEAVEQLFSLLFRTGVLSRVSG